MTTPCKPWPRGVASLRDETEADAAVGQETLAQARAALHTDPRRAEACILDARFLFALIEKRMIQARGHRPDAA